MAGADRHIVILADEIDYSVVEIQCRDHLRILFDKVADEWRNNALAEGNGARHIQRAARRPLTVAQRETLNPVFDHVSSAVRQSVRELGRGHDPGVALKYPFPAPRLQSRNRPAHM